MSDTSTFEFGTGNVARAYDDGLVPIVFRPWALNLVNGIETWDGLQVVDLAAGTGIVTEIVGKLVGKDGHVYAVDLNPSMLEVARERNRDLGSRVSFLEGPAERIDLPDEAVDVILCQQGIQFFPDRPAVGRELLRILKPGGRALVSTWLPVSECATFGLICDVLRDLQEPELHQMMRIPFDFMPAEELESMFVDAGFNEVVVKRVSLDLIVPDGGASVVSMAYASPIAPRLVALDDSRRAKFNADLKQRADQLSGGTNNMGALTSHVLAAVKPA